MEPERTEPANEALAIQAHCRRFGPLNWNQCKQRLRYRIVVNTDFCGKIPHFSAKLKIFLQTVRDAERALFARIQLGWSWARYPGRPRAFYGEPHVVTV